MNSNKIFLFLFCFLPMAIFAQTRFVENGGQWPVQVDYQTGIPGGKLYLESNRLLFDRYDMETTNAVFAAHTGNPVAIPIPNKLKHHAYAMNFVGAKNGVIPFGKKKAKTVYSYFKGNDPDKWGAKLNGFEEIWYGNIYPNIDLKVYRNAELKYDFVVKPGGSPSIIEIEYDGVKPILNENGQLEIETSIGQILESKPFAYQIIDGKIKTVECSYLVKSKSVKFVVGEYRADVDLIIDPELIFSTYSGSTSDNFGYSATYSLEGHLFSGSTAFGSGYPTTMGAYQTTWAGGNGGGTTGTDIAITKFSLDGTDLEYSTLLGGIDDELPHSLIADSVGNLYIMGTTGSSDFPVTANAYQVDFEGGDAVTPGGIGISYPDGCDIIVVKLNPDGTDLVGSTFVGGTDNDGLNTSTNLKVNYADEVRGEIEIEPSGNVIVGSSTFSDDFPVTSDAYQIDKGAGQDGIVFEMSSDLSDLLSASFFGGNQDDAIYSIHSTEDGLITVAGGTESDDLPASANAYQINYAGGNGDGMIAVFNSGLTTLTDMTYFGSSDYDQIYFIDRDEDGFPHIFGQTEAPDDTFIFQAVYSVPNSGMLVSKLNTDLSGLVWSTVFGDGENKPNLSPTAFSVDICNRVYLSGWGGGPNLNPSGNFPNTSTDNLPVTDDAIKSTTDGSDFYFMVLEGDASDIAFGSYFGGDDSQEHVDGGTSRFDRTGKIYQAVCAGCGSNDDFPIVPSDAWSPENNSSNCNLGVAKIDFDLPLIFADFEFSTACIPDSVIFENTSNLYTGSSATYEWFFPNNVVVTDENPSYVFDSPGTYQIQLVVNDPLACNLSDTIVKTVVVYSELELDIPDQFTSCDTDQFEMIALTNQSANFFEWSENADFTDIIQAGEVDSVLNYTTDLQHDIYLRISNGFCELIDTILVSPAPILDLSTADTLLCAEGEFDVNFILEGGTGISSIIWGPANKLIEGQGTDVALFTANEPFTIQLNIETEFGCEFDESIQIDVYPIFLEASDDTLSCGGEPILLSAMSGGSADSFIWSDQSDMSNILNPGGDSTITVVPTSIAYYYVLVENNGCFLKDSVAVSLLSAGTTITSDQYICLGDTANIIVSNDFPNNELEHFWEPEEYIVSGQNTSFIRVLVDQPTTFEVASQTAEGCVVLNSSTIFLSPLGGLDVDAFADPIYLTTGQTSQLTSSPFDEDYIYQWTPNTFLTNPNGASTMSAPTETITYILTITDFNDDGACLRTDSVTLFLFEAECSEPNIFVPNTFTPNGDGENDQLRVRGGNIANMEFSVFNRWGENIFKTNVQNDGWDGTFKGDLAEPAVYVYYLTVDCDGGESYFKKGNVTLIR